MDCRGSSIGRILNSYTEFAEKPQFYSNEYNFLVVLPNRSVTEPAQTSIDLTEAQSESVKTQLMANNNPADQDWE